MREAAESLGAADLRRRQPFVRHGLCRLAYPEDYTAAPADAEPNFAPWTSGVGACMLEALQPELAARWIEVEGGKSRIAEWQRMRDLGRSQERVLTAFLDAVEQAGRLDLARFLLRAAHQLLGEHADADMWVGGLTNAGPRLADRAATYQSALALLRQLPRLQSWERRARTVGYFDEGYQAAQLWKADWEQYQGDALHERARRSCGSSTRCGRRERRTRDQARPTMSRSYRISVRECVNRVIRAEDRVSTNLEMLEVLPPEQMAGLLATSWSAAASGAKATGAGPPRTRA